MAAGIREAIRPNCSVSFTVVLTTLLSFRGFRVSGSLQTLSFWSSQQLHACNAGVMIFLVEKL
jgi:hypothetical protein